MNESARTITTIQELAQELSESALGREFGVGLAGNLYSTHSGEEEARAAASELTEALAERAREAEGEPDPVLVVETVVRAVSAGVRLGVEVADQVGPRIQGDPAAGIVVHREGGAMMLATRGVLLVKERESYLAESTVLAQSAMAARTWNAGSGGARVDEIELRLVGSWEPLEN